MVACKVVKAATGSLDVAGFAAAEEGLLKEALLMAQVDMHPHLVALVGVITRGNPKVLVLSFCEHGELQGALKKRVADGDAFSETAKHTFCREVAGGMAHLGNHNFVHRDLAARNVLLGSGMICKVADFGLSRRVQTEDNTGDYYRSSGSMIPVRWTAPEGITNQTFSSASDVWSFGITCIEILLDGGRPYPTLKSNPAVIKLVCTEGGIHPRPSGCSEHVYTQLARCWSFDPSQRPAFTDLEAFFESAAAGTSGKDAEADTPRSQGDQAVALGVLSSVDGSEYLVPTPVAAAVVVDGSECLAQTCQYTSGSGRVCKSTLRDSNDASSYCANHACMARGCTASKPSAQSFCTPHKQGARDGETVHLTVGTGESRADQEEVDAERASEPASGIAETSFDATHVANVSSTGTTTTTTSPSDYVLASATPGTRGDDDDETVLREPDANAALPTMQQRRLLLLTANVSAGLRYVHPPTHTPPPLHASCFQGCVSVCARVHVSACGCVGWVGVSLCICGFGEGTVMTHTAFLRHGLCVKTGCK